MILPPVQAKPYRLINTIQHYAWGTSGRDAYIPRLLGVTPQPDIPYAELWLGAHPKAPSQVIVTDGEFELQVALDQWIAQYPDALLGTHIDVEFNRQLPFLTKVLSAGESLSIQAHPDKSQAQVLHARDPEHYADDNHKPEIAVALDGLSALMGFKPYTGILETLERYPELAQFLGEPLLAHLSSAVDSDLEMQRARTHTLFNVLIRRSISEPEVLMNAVEALADRLQNHASDETETRFLDLYQKYGSGDIGLFAFLLYNLVHLKPGEALYTPAGVPHAYLGGNIIECMANSDNVVRVGLTPKFKDAATLLGIVDTTPQQPYVMVAGKDLHETVYATAANEFELTRWQLAQEGKIEVDDRRGPAILIITEGCVRLLWDSEEMLLNQGESVLIPYSLSAFKLTVIDVSAQVFRTRVPNKWNEK